MLYANTRFSITVLSRQISSIAAQGHIHRCTAVQDSYQFAGVAQRAFLRARHRVGPAPDRLSLAPQ